MNLEQARTSFIDQWGALANQWGISKSTAEIYAYLLMQSSSRNTDQIMKDLSLSRGNVSMSARELIEWGIIFKSHRPHDRKVYYEAERDMWVALQRIMKERKRRELEPILKQINRWQQLKDPDASPSDVAAFKKTVAELREIGIATDQFIETVADTRRLKIYQWFHKLSRFESV